ncbi:MAG: type II toxin-antitoxin system RelB/DinJ family antitoxin [Synergistaceae bacterium]|jgi:DNA-damage-inducible protein J|nr:type II toxin-antitoxin system RelB/DinJ family antitoxin [Synergistaceae bacterium]
MTKTTSVFARVEPDLKEQAEYILGELGIPMSNAISLYLKQIVLQRGIPFDIKLPKAPPLSLGSLSERDIDAELEKGFADITVGRVRKATDVFADLKRDYGV